MKTFNDPDEAFEANVGENVAKHSSNSRIYNKIRRNIKITLLTRSLPHVMPRIIIMIALISFQIFHFIQNENNLARKIVYASSFAIICKHV